MSLINDALKKAQSMQPSAQGGGLKLASKPLTSRPASAPAFPAPSAPPAGPAAGPRLPAGSKTKHPQTGLILAIAGAVFAAALCVLGGVAVMLWKSGSEQIAAVTTVVETPPPPAGTTTAPEEPPAAPAGDASAPSIVLSTPAATPPVPAPGAQPEAPASDTAIAEGDIATPAQARPATPARPRDPKLQAYVLTIRVAGIRTGENPKALMNDRVYSIGEYVSPEHDLRLAGVDERMLELEDSHGNIYEVRF